MTTYTADFNQILRLVNAVEDAEAMLEALDNEIFANVEEEKISIYNPLHLAFHESRILRNLLDEALKAVYAIAPDAVDDLPGADKETEDIKKGG